MMLSSNLNRLFKKKGGCYRCQCWFSACRKVLRSYDWLTVERSFVGSGVGTVVTLKLFVCRVTVLDVGL